MGSSRADSRDAGDGFVVLEAMGSVIAVNRCVPTGWERETRGRDTRAHIHECSWSLVPHREPHDVDALLRFNERLRLLEAKKKKKKKVPAVFGSSSR